MSFPHHGEGRDSVAQLRKDSQTSSCKRRESELSNVLLSRGPPPQRHVKHILLMHIAAELSSRNNCSKLGTTSTLVLLLFSLLDYYPVVSQIKDFSQIGPTPRSLFLRLLSKLGTYHFMWGYASSLESPSSTFKDYMFLLAISLLSSSNGQIRCISFWTPGR